MWNGASIWLSGRNSALRAILLVAALGSAAILASGPLSAAVGAASPPVGEDSPPIGVDSPPVRVDIVECTVWSGAGETYILMEPSEGFTPRLVLRRDGKWLTTIDSADYEQFAVHTDEGLLPGDYAYELRYRIAGELFTVDCGTVQTSNPLRCVVRPDLRGTEATVLLDWQSNESRPKLQVRRDGRWMATVQPGDASFLVDDSAGAADASFEVRYRDDGERIDTQCIPEAPSLPWCGAFIEDERAEISVVWFEHDGPRVYQLRRNDKWAATATFDDVVTFEDTPAKDGTTEYWIRFRLGAELFEVPCEPIGFRLD